MPLAIKHRPTAASLLPDWVQAEDDGSIAKANVTALTAGTAIIQANGTIGDGPFGKTTGDFDAYTVLVSAGHLTVDIDAQILGSTLNAAIEVYSSAGTLVGSNDDEAGVGLDPFLRIFGLASDTYTVIVKAANSFILDPNNSHSGTGAGSKGDYRILINNIVNSSGENHLFHGSNNDETLNGAGFNDVLVGNGGTDTLNGLGGDDLFIWKDGDGNDIVDGGADFDVQEINASNNAETFNVLPFFSGPTSLLGVTGGAGGDAILLLDLEGLDIRALGGNDKLTVGDLTGCTLLGPIHFWGGAGNDTVDGSASINRLVLNGGLGKDRMTGGSAGDTFDFDFTVESRVGAKHDVITNFKHGQHDVIDLSDIDAKTGAGNQKFHWIGGGDFHDRKGELHDVKHGHSVIVEGDTNGDGKADFQIEVHGVAALAKGDFIL